jgi:hypothetical protein
MRTMTNILYAPLNLSFVPKPVPPKAMNTDQNKSFFGEIIYSYTRKPAIADGCRQLTSTSTGYTSIPLTATEDSTQLYPTLSDVSQL